MVFEPAIFEYLEDDEATLEVHGLERLAADNQISAYRHEGFWQCVDNIRELRMLRRMWDEGAPPWKSWSD